MQAASPATVLGDFADASITQYGVTSRFYRKGQDYFVETEGPDGQLHEYKIDYTFGVYPLQQYLIAFPGGRFQALSLAWDTRPKEQGGQRWFHLYPDEKIAHDDELHWTGINQNWNYMCADCHSTNLRRGYDLKTDSYHTTWSALNVSCEACHGPGSGHVAWAQRGATATDPTQGLTVLLRDRGQDEWAFPEGARIAKRMTPLPTHTETEVCAPCHARRSPLGDSATRRQAAARRLPAVAARSRASTTPMARSMARSTIYGSFVQSRMYRAGVTCSNCHEPHSLKLRAEGNAVCSQCHLPSAFDTPAHHFHTAGQPGSQCVDCHMPAKTYMVVDPRHDHGFRVPRPDLDRRTGAPDACTTCHAGKEPAWAAARIAEWYGPDRRRERVFGQALAAARTDAPGAGAGLVKLADDATAPAIARATAVAGLEAHPDQPALAAIQRALADPDPTIRLAAVGTLGSLDPQLRTQLGLPLLGDPVRAVRLDTARVLAPVSSLGLPADQRAALDAAYTEYEAAQKALLDRPEGLLTLGNFYRDRGRLLEAEEAYATAVRLHPGFVPSYANLADLLRQQGRDADGERVLQQGLGGGAGERRADPCAGTAADPPAALCRRGRGARQGRAARARQRPLRLCLCHRPAGDRQAGGGAGRAGAGA